MAEARIIEHSAFARHGRKVEYFTIAWNSLEGLVVVIAGAVAGSILLVGFGIDSFIEVTSGAALLWRMSVDADVHRRERNERLLSPFGYMAYESVTDLWSKGAPSTAFPELSWPAFR